MNPQGSQNAWSILARDSARRAAAMDGRRANP